MNRKLATIQKISNIDKIEGADKIEHATILGWRSVIEKGKFNIDDLIVFVEIDALLPERPEFEFLRKNKFRVRTCKFKNAISQGICFPLDILPISSQWHIKEMDAAYVQHIHGAEGAIGMDVSEVLGVEKYEAPIPAELAGEAKGGFPSFMQVTDEDRIQILPHIPEQYHGQSFIATEKLDGSSTTIFWKNGLFGVCGRNFEYYESLTNSMWKFANANKLEFKLGDLGRNLALQGEIIGEGIQKNRYKLKGQTIRFFRVFDIDKYEYLPYEEMIDIIENVLGLQTVPIIDMNYILPSSVDEIVQYADGKSILNPQTSREGVVFVRHELKNQGRLSFKAISNKFILKNDE